jgi:glycosyltransferase involved in cell wall biosynthesis
MDQKTLVNDKTSANEEIHSTGITAILPAYNEEVSVGSIVLRTKQYVDHVIVVDDGSADRTAEVAKMAGAQVVRHYLNQGKGAALKTGFEAALHHNSKIIVTLDTDGQHDPAEIPKITAPILSGEADMVNGSRYVNGDKKDTPAYRRLGQTVLDKATNINSGIHITDTQSGFRAFGIHTVPAFKFTQNDFGIESEMLIDAAKADLHVKEVEIGVRYDVDCSTEHPISHGMRVLVKLVNDMELNRPLNYFTLPGSLMVGVGMVMGLSFLREFYIGGSLMFGPTLLMIMMTLIGTFMSFTGIILHSMSRMIKEAKL